MMKLTVFTSAAQFAQDFERCCLDYGSLSFATAWIGDPRHAFPYAQLQQIRGQIIATVGYSFNSTHPKGLDYLISLKAQLRMFREDAGIFHPKVYLFSQGRKSAVFIGSSNLTYSGFCKNVEVNMLLEGIPSPSEELQLRDLQHQLTTWQQDTYSFAPSAKWLQTYRQDFQQTLNAQRRGGVRSPALNEETLPQAGWLEKASWAVFYRKVVQALKDSERDRGGYLSVLKASQQSLSFPWSLAHFKSLEKRKIMFGGGDYAWLGHVGASGKFLHLLAKGDRNKKLVIVNTMNAIINLELPLDWSRLGALLQRLCSLGPTMKVWSRLLCITRPDLYCTVSSISVRKNLSEVLGISKSHFQSPEGYIQLLQALHSAPWFQSERPTKSEELEVWNNRGAFIDAIFYD